jgi:hypothetical protein
MSEPLPGDEASTGTGPVGQVSFAAPGVLPPYSAGMYPPLDGALGAEAPMWLWSPELSAGTTRGGRASTGLTIGVHGSLDAYAPRPPLPMAFKPVPVPAPMGAPSCSPWDRQAVAERGGSFGWGRPSAGASRTAEQPWRTHSALPAWPGGGGSADPLWWPTEATQAAPELNLQALMHLLHEDGGSASTASVETGEYASAHPADYPPHAPQHPSWPEHELALRRPLQAQLHAAQPQLAAQHVAQPYGSLHYPPPLYPPPAFSSPPRAPDGMLGSGGLPLMPMLIPEQLAVLASMPPVARPDGGAMSANDMWLQVRAPPRPHPGLAPTRLSALIPCHPPHPDPIPPCLSPPFSLQHTLQLPSPPQSCTSHPRPSPPPPPQMPQSHMLQQHAAMRSMSAHPPLPSSSTSLCSCDSNSSGSSAGASQPSSLFSSATSSYATSATSSASRVPSLPLSSGQGHCLLSALTAAPPLLPTYPPHATLPGPPAGTLDPASAGFGPSDLPPHYHSSAALAQLPLAHISPASLLQAVHASYLYSQAGQIPPHEPQPPYAPGAAPHGYTEQNSAASSVHSHDGRRSRRCER